MPYPQTPPDDRANGRALIGSGVSGCIGEFAGAASRDVRLQFTTVLKGT